MRSSVEVGATSWMRRSSGRWPGRDVGDDESSSRRRRGRRRRSAPSRTPRAATRTSSGRAACRRRARASRRGTRGTARVRIPRASARSAARWITGPSASGSENGKPSSMMSAPPSTAACGERRRLGLADQVDDERLARSRAVSAASAASASARSLSPRPERQTATYVGVEPVDDARARAHDSSAGMIPSVRESRWNASSASSSVHGDVRRRGPVSRSYACSGPTPG